MTPSLTTPAAGLTPNRPNRPDLRETAEMLEAEFLSEMLGHAGLGKARDSFGGGIGEEQFASFLQREQAGAMARKGGIGLAEAIFNALQRASDA